jgi:aspartyl-tRNA(Asn)/glutamyl-tRNA(Gln) amidotransferase subunit C
MIDENDTRKIAKLAHLKIADADIASYTKEVNSILEYVNQLQKIDVSNIEPLSHVHGSTNIFREDTVVASLSNEDALRNAPDKSGRFFKVPIIIDQSGEH